MSTPSQGHGGRTCMTRPPLPYHLSIMVRYAFNSLSLSAVKIIIAINLRKHQSITSFLCPVAPPPPLRRRKSKSVLQPYIHGGRSVSAVNTPRSARGPNKSPTGRSKDDSRIQYELNMDDHEISRLVILYFMRRVRKWVLY